MYSSSFPFSSATLFLPGVASSESERERESAAGLKNVLKATFDDALRRRRRKMGGIDSVHLSF